FRQIAKVGYLYDVESHELPLNKLFGNVFGRIIDYTLIFFMFVTSFIMLAGGGSNLNESFGMPTWIGTIIMIILVSVTLMLDFNMIINLLGFATPILLIILLKSNINETDTRIIIIIVPIHVGIPKLSFKLLPPPASIMKLVTNIKKMRV